MGKPKKKPRLDFAQNALSNLLKATGVTQLIEPKIVQMPKSKKMR